MKIKLDDDYYIDVSERNHTLMRKGLNKNKDGENYGKETITIIGYYSDFPRAVIGYLNHSDINEQQELTIKDYVERYKDKCDEVISRLGETK